MPDVYTMVPRTVRGHREGGHQSPGPGTRHLAVPGMHRASTGAPGGDLASPAAATDHAAAGPAATAASLARAAAGPVDAAAVADDTCPKHRPPTSRQKKTDESAEPNSDWRSPQNPTVELQRPTNENDRAPQAAGRRETRHRTPAGDEDARERGRPAVPRLQHSSETGHAQRPPSSSSDDEHRHYSGRHCDHSGEHRRKTLGNPRTATMDLQTPRPGDARHLVHGVQRPQEVHSPRPASAAEPGRSPAAGASDSTAKPKPKQRTSPRGNHKRERRGDHTR